MPERLAGSVCPFCGAKEYGDNEDSPIAYECGSGYTTWENLPEDFSQSTGCAIIRELLKMPSQIVAWLRSDECYEKYVDIAEGNYTVCEPDDLADAIERGEFLA